jgi:hypothetical protein
VCDLLEQEAGPKPLGKLAGLSSKQLPHSRHSLDATRKPLAVNHGFFGVARLWGRRNTEAKNSLDGCQIAVSLDVLGEIPLGRVQHAVSRDLDRHRAPPRRLRTRPGGDLEETERCHGRSLTDASDGFLGSDRLR